MPARTIGVAIPIPEPYGGDLQAWRRKFGDPLADVVPPHVTLVPPTPVRERELPAIEAHLLAVAALHRPFGVELRGTGTFRPVSPVVFVALARGISDCERLADRARSGPLRQDSQFPYHPHVTVAHNLSDAELDRAFETLAGVAAGFEVTVFSLYEHGSDGVWRPQRDFVLDGPLVGPRPRRLPWPGRRRPPRARPTAGPGGGTPPVTGSPPGDTGDAAEPETGGEAGSAGSGPAETGGEGSGPA